MSVLDMFASALGAFILITVILFPYYNTSMRIKKSEEELKSVDVELVKVNMQIDDLVHRSAQLNDELRQVKTNEIMLEQCKHVYAMCKDALTKTFLTVVIEWREPCDVDLYVTDPDGQTFSYAKKTFPGSEAVLSLDMKYGPGIEIWGNPNSKPGLYKVSYDLFSVTYDERELGEHPVNVRGWLIDRSVGLQSLPVKTLAKVTRGAGPQAVANVLLKEDGSVTVRPID
jgi:cell division protein FtsB